MTPRRRRLWGVLAGVCGLAVAAAFVLNAFRSNMVFFFAPSQVASGEAPVVRPFRLGGMVQAGSLRRDADGLTVHFIVSDAAHTVPVTYRGLLPDLFGEKRGVVAQGRLGADGVFVAQEILAKHDENYMPPGVMPASTPAADANAPAAARAMP